jgi:hypothetical protein
MLHEHLNLLALEARHLGVHESKIATVTVATNSTQRTNAG